MYKKIIIFGIFSLALFLRLYGLIHNHPFWIDEFATADQARLIAKHGVMAFFSTDNPVEQHNMTTYTLVAFFFKLFGPSEFIARLPFAIIGALVPVAIFLFASSFLSTTIAFSASLLATFSYFQITWSRQARGYMLLQLIIILTLYAYLNMRKKNKLFLTDYLSILSLFILGVLTHSLYILLIIAIAIDLLIRFRNTFFQQIKKPQIYILVIALIAILYITGTARIASEALISAYLQKVNNVWYYHSFLWREYNLITFLAICGLFFLISKKKHEGFLILLYILLNLLFISFGFAHYMSKYLLPIFPLLLICVGIALEELCNTLPYKKIAVIGFTLFIIINGNKFVTKPKQYYSVNHDFREIAIIDYRQIYDIIKNKSKLINEKVAMIDTWPARSYWYLGPDTKPLYILRWKNEIIAGNGQKITKTKFSISTNGEKIVPKNRGLLLIEDVSDLKRTILLHPHGFILIDDTTLPRDVIEYAEKNFKKELYLDHYPLDDNPYSIWPITLYSWGFR